MSSWQCKVFLSPVVVPCLAIWAHSLGKLSRVQELVQPLCRSLQAPVRDWSLLVLSVMNLLAVLGSPRVLVFFHLKKSQLVSLRPLLRVGFHSTCARPDLVARGRQPVAVNGSCPIRLLSRPMVGFSLLQQASSMLCDRRNANQLIWVAMKCVGRWRPAGAWSVRFCLWAIGFAVVPE